MQKGVGVAAQQLARGRMVLPRIPLLAGFGLVGFAFGVNECLHR